MRFLKIIISFNTLIILASFMLLFAFYGLMKEAYYNKNKLIEHVGIVMNKRITTVKNEQNRTEILYITLDDSVEYKISKYVTYADGSLLIGDTVKILTKPTVTAFGNFVTSENGSGFWTTKHKNEVYELYSFKDKTLIIDFQQHKDNLKKTSWVLPAGSLLFLGWFLYRRSGMKSPFITQSDD